MPHIVTVRCPQCGFTWEEDLDWHLEHDTLHAAGADRGTFRFKCPQDGTWVTVEAGKPPEASGSGLPGMD